MNRIAFKQLLKKYISDTANEAEKALIDYWYELLYNDNITALNDNDLESLEQEMWNKIEEEARLSKKNNETKKMFEYRIIFKWAAAAAVLFGLSFSAYNFLQSSPKYLSYEQIKIQYKLNEVKNSYSQPKDVLLEDGTIITLQAFSKVAYPNHFSAEKREVYLEGEAFFKVTKNAAKPFLVHSGKIVTQVLGTSFNIKPSKEDNQIMVAVKTGRVAVFEDNEQVLATNEKKKNNGIIITPNQKVIYNNKARNFVTALVESPQIVIPDEGKILSKISFVFDDIALEKVLENIGKMYAIEILVENEDVFKCKFTGDIASQSLYDKLALICQSTNHQYEIVGTKILIKGKGCN